jgi:hypothetical protein
MLYSNAMTLLSRTTSTPTDAPAGDLLRLESADACLDVLLTESACMTGLVLTDRVTGRSWRSGPPVVEVMWDALQRVEAQPDMRCLSATRSEDGAIELAFFCPRSEVGFTLRVELAGPDLRVTLPFARVQEGRAGHYRLFAIRPTPGLMTATGDEAVLVPLVSGALVRPEQVEFAFEDRFLIYGQQPRWEDLPLLPVSAVYRDGHDGLMAMIESGDCDAAFELSLDGRGTGVADFSCGYRQFWPDRLDASDRTICYGLLRGQEAGYVGVGRRLQRMFREVHGVTTLSQRAQRNPDIAQLARSLVVKTFHAMKDIGYEAGDGPYRVFQPFAETADQLAKLKAAGIADVYVQLVGWNIDGHDGRYPQRFPVDDRLGGEAGLRALVKAGQSLGYQMQVHDNYVDSTDPEHPAVIRNLWGDPLPRGLWGGGCIYAMNPLKYDRAWLRSQMEQIKALGIRGVYYLDAMSPPLEVDYDPSGPAGRAGHAAGIGFLMDLGRSVFNAVGAECPFAHVARRADYVPSPAVRPAGRAGTKIWEIVSEWVPVWHVAFHGLLVHAQQDAGFPNVSSLLAAAEVGSVPRSDFTGANPEPGNLMAERWSERLPQAFKAKHDILIGRLGANVFSPITGHECTGPRCYRTTFENGSIVEVDYAAERLWIDGDEWPIPPVLRR